MQEMLWMLFILTWKKMARLRRIGPIIQNLRALGKMLINDIATYSKENPRTWHVGKLLILKERFWRFIMSGHTKKHLTNEDVKILVFGQEIELKKSLKASLVNIINEVIDLDSYSAEQVHGE